MHEHEFTLYKTAPHPKLGLLIALQTKDGPQEVGNPSSFHPTFQKPKG